MDFEFNSVSCPAISGKKMCFMLNIEKSCNLFEILWRKHGKSIYQNG